MRTPFTGAGTALITPFNKDGSLDEAGIKRLTRRQIDGGIHFLVPCGTTGESPTLSHRERVRVVELVVEESNGTVPVMAGAGGNNTHEVVELARDMAKAGADGLLSVAPYYNKPNQEGLYRHFAAIAESTPLPITLYNVPGRTGVNIDAATVARLSLLPNIVAVKEASANVAQMAEIVARTDDDFLLLSGDDPLTVAVMAIGGRGVISVVSNQAPSEVAQVVQLCERNDYAGARKLDHWLIPLYQVNFLEGNPGPCKAIMAAMGLVEETYRLPLAPPSPATREKFMRVLQDLKLLGAAARA
jgi:4-hydroxy-tetrahydrodipicolinate synthase